MNKIKNNNSNAEILYNLNKYLIKYRYSKAYLIGKRLIDYCGLLKSGKIFILINKLILDLKVMHNRKKASTTQYKYICIDFEHKYTKEKIAVYTSIYGNYDYIYEPLFIDASCDYYIFTDIEVPKNSIWKKRCVQFPEFVNTNFLKNRYVKIFANKFFPNYQFSVYIDGNIRIVSEISLYFSKFISNTGIAMHKHPSSNGLYDEIDMNLLTNKISKTEAKRLRNLFYKAKIPKDFGMHECNVILRKHNDKVCIDIMNSWWNMIIDNGINRDQLCFSFVLFQKGFKFSDVALIGDNINYNPMFIREHHIVK